MRIIANMLACKRDAVEVTSGSAADFDSNKRNALMHRLMRHLEISHVGLETFDSAYIGEFDTYVELARHLVKRSGLLSPNRMDRLSGIIERHISVDYVALAEDLTRASGQFVGISFCGKMHWFDARKL